MDAPNYSIVNSNGGTVFFSQAYESSEIKPDVADFIVTAVNSHADLLSAAKAAHNAIDILFVMLIEPSGEKFYPSKSGKPWAALLQLNAAIASTINDRKVDQSEKTE